jgi:hypothetical protein
MHVSLRPQRARGGLHEAVRMAHQRPTDQLRGTEPARQASDPSLEEGDDSRPGVALAIGFLVVFLIVIAAAIAFGVIG